MPSAVAAAYTSGTILMLHNFALSVYSSAESALNALASLEIPYELGPTETTFSDFKPYDVETPTIPSDVVITSPPAVPDLNNIDPPTKPDPVFPPEPSISDIAVPDAPALNSATMDTVTLGSLLSLSLPEKPEVVLESFSVTAPAEITVEPVIWSFSVDSIMISDDPVVNALRDRLISNIVNGGTGLSQSVEADIWNRDLERMEQQIEDTTDKVLSGWAKRGFSLPDGLLAHSLSEVQKEYLNKRIDRSREIAIEQAKLEQNNLFKSMEIAVDFAFKLFDTLMKYQQLLVSTQEMTAKYANEYIRLMIETHNSKIDLYKAKVSAYEILVRTALVQVEIYKAQLEGELAKVNINEQTVKVYSAQLTAAIAKYRGTLEGNQLLAQIYGTEMQGALTHAQVQETTVKVYAERIRAAMATVDVYKAQVDGYVAELQAEKVKIDAAVASVGAWAKEMDARIANLNAQIEAAKATSQYNISAAEINNKAAETTIRLQLAEAQLALANAEVSSRAITALGNAKVEAARGVAAAAASMAAGAMAAVSAHSSMSYSESMTVIEE